MAKSSESLLSFNDFENFDDSPEITAGVTKKSAATDGRMILFGLFTFLVEQILRRSWKCQPSNRQGVSLSNRILPAILQC